MAESWNDRVAAYLKRLYEAGYTDGATSIVNGLLMMGAVEGVTVRALSVNEDGELRVSLETGDIQIGAVELKDADSAVRVDIKLDRAKNALYIQSEIYELWNEWNRLKVDAIVGQSGLAGGAGAESGATIRTVAATDSPEVTALEIIDNWDFNDVARMSPIVGQTAISAGAGAQDVRTTRTVTATDSPDVTALEIMDDWDATTDSTASTDGPQIKMEYREFDGSALPSQADTEGDAINPVGSDHGPIYVFPTSADGAKTAYDDANNVFRTMETADARQQSVTWEIQSATLTTSIERQIGGEINCQGFNVLVLYFDYNKGTETKVVIIPYFLPESGDSGQQIGAWDAAAGSKGWTLDSFDLEVTSKPYLVLDVSGLNYTILTETASDVNPTGTIQITASLVNNA